MGSECHPMACHDARPPLSRSHFTHFANVNNVKARVTLKQMNS